MKMLRQALSPANILRALLYAGVPAVLIYGISLAVLSSSGYKIVEILRDPAQQSGQSSFLGFVSNIGVWIWISAAAICFFRVLTAGAEISRRRRELLLLVGMLSLLLGVDDFFLIHDRYVNQKLCYGIYAVLAGALLARHYVSIFKIDGFTFLFAGGLLALSIVTDLSQPYIPLRYSHSQIIEEGCKFVGAAFWLYFGARAASTP